MKGVKQVICIAALWQAWIRRIHLCDECSWETVCRGGVECRRVKGIEVIDIAEVTEMAEMAGMSELSEMSEDYIRAARHATVRPVSKMSEMSEMAEMPNMTTRHVMRGLGEVAV
jgi:hypothetical protein